MCLSDSGGMWEEQEEEDNDDDDDDDEGLEGQLLSDLISSNKYGTVMFIITLYFPLRIRFLILI